MNKSVDSWAIVELEKLVQSQKGKKPNRFSDQPKEGFLPYIDIRAFEKNEIRRYAESGTSKLANENDILVVWDGARSGFVGIGIKGAIGSTIVALKIVVVNSKYIYRFLQTQFDYINSNPRGTGIPHVEPKLFWKLQVPLAPLNEQKRIVEKLDKLLAKVESAKSRLDKIPTLLKRFRQSVLAAAVSGELTKDWREKNLNHSAQIVIDDIYISKTIIYRNTYDLAIKNNNKKPSPFKQNDEPIQKELLPEIPNTWKWDRLVNITHIQGGVTKGRKLENHKKIELPYLRVANVQDGFLDLSEIKTIPIKDTEKEKYLLKKGDILFTEGGDRDKLGRGTIWNGQVQDCIHQNHIFRARPYSNKLISEYISFVTKSEFSKTYFMEKASQTVNLASINMTNLGDLPVPIAPYDEQKEIVKRVETLYKTADQIEERYQKAKAYVDKLQQSILAKAFRGELVPQDPNDEPAEKLLEWIREERGNN